MEVRAQLELARMYARGEGVAADPDEAMKWYSLVAAEEQSIDDLAIAAFAGAVTSSEIQEAKDYVASRR